MMEPLRAKRKDAKARAGELPFSYRIWLRISLGVHERRETTRPRVGTLILRKIDNFLPGRPTSGIVFQKLR
jgi:hypothetical protein